LTDLSHWDFAERFSGYDAAALILGLEPRESEADEWRVRVVCERMELHYKRALLREFERFLGDPARPVSDDDDREPEKDLRSVKLDDLVFRATQFEAHQHLSDWFADRRLNRFENQEFTRKAIARWLVAIGMDSKYQFDRLRSPDTDRRKGRWPWGDHHTKLLGHLEAAAMRYWVNFDPADPKTANTNETVSEWLCRERKVSRTMADAIASILRADGLPTGPRK
jgi:hypothetical protein